jgi:hypothetical protein
MELIRTLREKSQTRKEEEIRTIAADKISISDFDNNLYIAFDDAPLVLLDENLTCKQIVGELSRVRENYINSRLKDEGLPRIAAVL